MILLSPATRSNAASLARLANGLASAYTTMRNAIPISGRENSCRSRSQAPYQA